MPNIVILFLIIFLEGYVVLSTELLAIRLLIPFTGSGTDTISIIIAAVLMPLAFGYYAGGQFKMRREGQHVSTIRQKLLLNFLIAAGILTFALSYAALEWSIGTLYPNCGAVARLLITAVYAAVCLVYPVFLLGQTIPLISNYFPRSRLPVMAGKILFFSTLGSFMGAIFCTMVLMTFLGVHYAAAITIVCLAVLSLMLARRKTNPYALATVAFAIIAIILNSPPVLKHYNVVADNQHHLIQAEDFAHMRILRINRNMSAGIDQRTGKSAFEYILFVERTFIDPTLSPGTPPIDVLVLGAGGFTFGVTDKKNNYVYVDIDPELKDIAERELLREQLTENKEFAPVPARAYLQLAREQGRQFDMILLDVYHGPAGPPEHLVTKEFFEQVKGTLKPGGIMVANMITSNNFTDPFAVRLDNTMRYVFKNLNRQVIEPYDGWRKHATWENVIYSYHHNPDAPDEIYTDLKNTSGLDKPGKFN